MVWRIEFDPDALKELEALDPSLQRQVVRYLRERLATADDPRRFGKPLRGDLKNLWRYRVGDLRLICQIREDRLVVFVLRVGHRRDVYS